MKKSFLILLFIAVAVTGSIFIVPRTTQAHCQIPCGIYDDHARVQSMLEDAATVEKAIQMITELSGKTDVLSQNQMVRWIMNKEEHAQNVIVTISDYFLTQRIKPDQEDYVERLKKHHAVIVAAMKVKQTVDSKSAASLKESIAALESYYPEPDHDH